MITKDVGKYYSQTQKRVEQLKQNVEQLHLSNTANNDLNLKNICGVLQKNMENINQDVEKKMDDLFYNMINNYNHTVQELKEIKQITQHDHGSSTTGVTNRKASITDSRGSGSIQDNSNKDLNTEDKKNSFWKYQENKKAYKPKHNSDKQLQKSILNKLTNLKGIKNSAKSMLPQVNEVSFSETDMKEGMLSLINKGKIPKGVNLNQMFTGKDNTLLLSKPAKINKFQEINQKRSILSNKEVELTTFKLEPPTEQNLPKIEKKLYTKPPSDRRQKTNNYSIGALYNFLSIDTTFKKKPETSNKEFTLEKIDAKTYPQVMDSYSLHHFLIRKGRVLEETPEFQSYQRTYNNQWNYISTVLKELERLMKDYNISLATVDGKALASLGQVNSSPSIEDLVECIVNKDDILKIIKLPKLMFKGPFGKQKAAIKIQSNWRRFKNQREYERLKILIKKVKVIQEYFRIQLTKKGTKIEVKNRNEKNIEKFHQMKAKLQEDWPIWKLKKRVEIHINTFSYDELKRLTMEKVSQRQNIQITRIFAIKDPLVEIIYISPFDLSSEIINYYYKILELNGITDYKDRLHFIWPEQFMRFPSHFSTSRLLLYSPKALFRIKQLIKNKNSIIIPGFPSNDDVKLSTTLNVPLYSGDPQQHLFTSTKSGSKRIFQQAEVPIPPGAFEIYDEKEFINTLAILIVNNLSVENWIFKMDDENLGRGLAYLDVNSIKYLRQIRKIYGEIEINNEFLQKITDILSKKLPYKLKISVKTLYPTYKQYLQDFLSKGGVIEACPAVPIDQIKSPSIFFEIDPVGAVQVHGSFDKISGPDFRNIACAYPQSSLQNMNLELLCQSIAKVLFKRGIFGYLIIDLISFPDLMDPGKHPLFWAIGLDCFHNNYSTACNYFYFLVKGKCDPLNGSCILQNNDNQLKLSDDIQSEAKSMQEQESIQNNLNERCFIYCPQLQHTALESLQFKTFFHLCRVESISFDLEKKIGSTFLLIDSLQSGILGLMTIGENKAMTLKYMNDSFKFLTRHLGQSSEKFQKTDICESRNDKIFLSDIQSKLKLMMRKYDRDYSKNYKPTSYKDNEFI